MKNKTKEFFLNLFFPRFCLGCKKEETYLCQDCRATLEISEHQYCLCNKNPLRLPSPTHLSTSKGCLPPHLSIGKRNKAGKCKRCYSKKLSGLYSSLSYQEKSLTKKLIHQFKYPPYIKELAKPLSSLIIEHFLLLNKNPQQICQRGILISVPLFKRKLKKRGFNQTEEIAKELSKTLMVPLISDNLIKIKETSPQVELSEKERRENLRSAFFCKNPALIKQKKIFLIDDVYTTGSTMEECAKTLKKSGAKEVWGIVVARG